MGKKLKNLSKKFKKWKSLGRDNIPNLYLNASLSMHRPLADLFSNAINNPKLDLECRTQSITYLNLQNDDTAILQITSQSHVYPQYTKHSKIEFKQRKCIDSLKLILFLKRKKKQKPKKRLFFCCKDQ